MVTYTLPSQLRAVIRANDEVLKTFISACAQALEEILADPKHCGFFKSGFIGVYQSWRQDMLEHPHTHWIVPGVGLGDQDQLVKLKKFDFLVYAGVLAKRMKTVMLKSLQKHELISRDLLRTLWRIDWNADVQHVGAGEQAVKYLGQYVSRSVISDKRIVKVDADFVWIRVKDRDLDKYYSVKIDGVEFVRRFLMHALPPGFHRIRYRGFMHARGKPGLQWLQVLLQAKLKTPLQKAHEAIQSMICPQCGGQSRRTQQYARAPPRRRYRKFIERMTA